MSVFISIVVIGCILCYAAKVHIKASTEDLTCARLVAKIKSFILELGRGFSFIGNQYCLEYNNKEYGYAFFSPKFARCKSVTYSAPLYAEIAYKQRNKFET